MTPRATATLQQCVEYVWMLRRLFFAGALDRLAALHTLDLIYVPATNPRLRRLCETLVWEMYPELRLDQATAGARPIDEAFAS